MKNYRAKILFKINRKKYRSYKMKKVIMRKIKMGISYHLQNNSNNFSNKMKLKLVNKKNKFRILMNKKMKM